MLYHKVYEIKVGGTDMFKACKSIGLNNIEELGLLADGVIK